MTRHRSPPPLSDAMLEALAVLRSGPAERTLGRSVDASGTRKVNTAAAKALMRRDLAVPTARRTFAITIAGIMAYDEAMAS